MNMMTHWNPFRDMDDFFRVQPHRGLGRHFPHEGLLSADWTPSVDITESDQEFLIKVELPEVKKEDIKVDLDKGVLTITGERRSEHKDEKEHRLERYYGSFARSFTLPDNVNEAGISAENRDGMLYLHLPKTEHETPKKIQVDIK